MQKIGSRLEMSWRWTLPAVVSVPPRSAGIMATLKKPTRERDSRGGSRKAVANACVLCRQRKFEEVMERRLSVDIVWASQ
jgi:hypothetical protein